MRGAGYDRQACDALALLKQTDLHPIVLRQPHLYLAKALTGPTIQRVHRQKAPTRQVVRSNTARLHLCRLQWHQDDPAHRQEQQTTCDGLQRLLRRIEGLINELDASRAPGRLASMSSWSAGPTWGVSSGVKLQSQLDDDRVSHLDRTIRPFESRTRSSTQTKPRTRESERFPRDPRLSSVKESRPSQRMQQQPRLTQSRLQSQPRQERSRPTQQVQKHSPAPRRSLRLSQLSSRPSEQQPRSQRAPDRRMSSLQPLTSHRMSIALESRSSQRISLSDLSGDRGDVSVELSRARRREIMSRVTASVQEVMDSMLPGRANTAQWKSKLRKKSIDYYVDETSVKPGQTRTRRWTRS